MTFLILSIRPPLQYILTVILYHRDDSIDNLAAFESKHCAAFLKRVKAVSGNVSHVLVHAPDSNPTRIVACMHDEEELESNHALRESTFSACRMPIFARVGLSFSVISWQLTLCKVPKPPRFQMVLSNFLTSFFCSSTPSTPLSVS